MRTYGHSIVMACLLALPPGSGAAAGDPLVSLEYRVNGVQLRVHPQALSVPKGIAGSVAVDVVAGDDGRSGATRALTEGAHVEATLRGPSFPARRILGLPNEALLLPVLNLVGDYQLDGIKLVDSTTGEVRLEGMPSSVPVRVFDELLVSRVTSRPLTSREIEEKGIVIDESSFRAVEFEVGFVVDGATIPVKFPVVAPSFAGTTELIPQAELEERLVEAERVNGRIAAVTELPPELEVTGLNIEIKGISFQFVDAAEAPDLALQIPPIPAVMVIPGNIGFLNQFFSVQIFTENAAPADSGLSVRNLSGELVLPVGPDLVQGTHDEPGDDPLRFARVGPAAEIRDVVPIVQPGPDGDVGTADDVGRLFPGEGGQAEFLVEGLREGLHLMDVRLAGTLDGLAAGSVEISGSASGSILVRNPNFSLAFSHPRTIRSGEPYVASVTILNTSEAMANQVRVSLPPTSISGAVLQSPETVALGDIAPGETRTATYRLLAQRTGSITFSQLSSDTDIVGRFRLRMGVDERGVALSPDAIGYPDFAQDLPGVLLDAANRVLGQALSVATAGQLPAGVQRVRKSTITRRVVELAEAGQRLRYGDLPERVMADLMLDWQGARRFDPGFDQVLRETDAGRAFRETLMEVWLLADHQPADARLEQQAGDLAGRGEAWSIAASSSTNIWPSLQSDAGAATLDGSHLAQTLAYRGEAGHWLVAPPGREGVLRFDAVAAIPATRLTVLSLTTDGRGTLLTWSLDNVPAGACFSFDPQAGVAMLDVDEDCDGVIDDLLPAVETPISEPAPTAVAVLQDTSVHAGRPDPSCLPPYDYRNYGTVVAVLFSKPMAQEDINVPDQYIMDNGLSASSVRVQPGGRVALLNLQAGVGTVRARNMTISRVADPRGNVMGEVTLPVQTTADQGAALSGRVARADGSPAIEVPVTLTYYDEVTTAFGCEPFVVRVAQVTTDESGLFSFDFVMAGVPYSVSATDTSGMTPEAIDLVLESAAGDVFARQKLLALASSPSARGTLLETFAVGSLPEAVAVAEGLDRALVRDVVHLGEGRVGTEIVVALRFRGRGTVRGMVLSPGGGTAAGSAAVNLFPDPGSRELGRGLHADSSGRFAFFGVPLGTYTVEVADDRGRRRTVSGLLDQVGQVEELEIEIADTQVTLTGLQGRVFEAEGVYPHANAPVFVGRYVNGRFRNVVAAVEANAQGYWSASDIPVGTWDVVAVSFDGKRKGERRDVAASTGIANQVNITLQGRAVVHGRVEYANGNAVAHAVVAGGDTLARTDEHGAFSLTGVPVGPGRSISAGVERNPAAGVPFPRIGSARLDVVPGADNFVVVRLTPRGSISGRVFDAAGSPIPHARVAIPRPQENGFMWVEADEDGTYLFENLALDAYTLSAPAPATGPDTDVSGVLDTLRNQDATEDEVKAALGEAFALFTGANDPLLNGEGRTFNPLTWGYAKTRLTFDGDTRVVDIRFLPEGTVSGTVLNGQGVPIGARVRLTGIGPTPFGDVGFIIRGERNSDPALGTFEFPGQLLAGSWGLQAASPFFPVVVTDSGQTFPAAPDVTDVVLQFPPEQVINGRLRGTVLSPDGEPAGADVEVKISFGDLTIRTDSNGVFDTQIDLPAVNEAGRRLTYTVEAEDLGTGLKGKANALMTPGATTDVTVVLLDKGDLHIRVVQADGTPAPGAKIAVTGGSFPFEFFSGTAGADGELDLFNLFEGRYSVCGQFITGITTIAGRSGVTVTAGDTASVVVRLTPTGTIRGVFLEEDRVTPVAFAQVSIGNIGYASTGPDGTFEVMDIPLGSYRLVGSDPVNGRIATLNTTLAADGEIQDVQLVVRALGEITGSVINSLRTGMVPGARVTLRVADGITPERSVTTGPDGVFRFPGTPAGDFQLVARDPVSRVPGHAAGTLPEEVEVFTLNVELSPRGSIAGTVFRPDGSTPETNATVTLNKVTIDTDGAGRVQFSNLALRSYTVRAESLTPGETHSAAEIQVRLTDVGPAPEFVVTLQGVGSLAGTVFGSDGVTPMPGAEVRVTMQSPLFGNETDVVLADGTGAYRFDNVAVGPYRLTARDGALATTHNGELSTDRESQAVDLTLGSSGSVVGRLVEADGTTPVAAAVVSLGFSPPSGLLGRATDVSDQDGRFAFSVIPVGDFSLETIVPSHNGIARRVGAIVANGETVDVGDVVLDQAQPFVESVLPADTSAGIPVTTAVILTFSEALDPGRIDPDAIYLRSDEGGIVPATVFLLPDSNGVARVVRVQPGMPLLSEHTYEIVVVAGDRLNATGSVTARGPVDLVGRALPSPFISSFTTRDDDPPVLLSFTPDDGAVQVDPSAVVRLSFNEAIQPTGIVLKVSGPAGPVAGSVDVGVNNLVVVFTPDAPLSVNAAYTATVDGLRDIAGNMAAGLPRSVTFETLDTLGPEIQRLRVRGGAAPLAGSTVEIEAILAEPETNAALRMSADLVPFGQTEPNHYALPYTLPQEGSVTFRAVAIDRYGNEGPLAERVIAVTSNQPPRVLFERVSPVDGPVRSGSFVVVDVAAVDDGRVAELRAAMSGAVEAPLVVSTGGTVRLQGRVAASAGPEPAIQVLAEAVDDTGRRSGEQVLHISVADATPPSAEVRQVTPDRLLDPGETISAQVAADDNFGVSEITLQVSGAVTGEVRVILDPPSIAAVETLQFLVPAETPPDGAPVRLTVTATDSTGLVSSARHVDVSMRDRTPPAVVSMLPPDGATGVSATPTLQAVFTEPLDPGTANLTNVTLTTATGGTNVEIAVVLAPDAASLDVTPAAPLLTDVEYRWVLGSALADPAGNTLTGEVASVFRTGAFGFIAPLPGSRVIETQAIEIEADSAEPIGLDSVRYLTSTGVVALAVNAPYRVVTAVPRLSDLGGSVWTLHAEGLDATGALIAAASVQVDVQSLTDDADGDGLDNGSELAAGTDPFRDDAGEDLDGDGLLNRDEVNQGTDPFHPDTDGDGQPDGTDPHPLHANKVPVAGTVKPHTAVHLPADGDDLRISDRAMLDPAQGTIECWFRQEGSDELNHIFYAGRAGDGFGSQNEMHLHTGAGQTIGFHGHYGGATRWNLSGGTVETGRLHHVAVTWSEAEGLARLYLDGNLVDQGVFNGFGISSFSHDVRFGRHNGSAFPERGFTGLLDEMRCWNVARDQASLRRDMHRVLSGEEAGLAVYAPADEGAGDAVFDHTRNRFDGMLTPGAEWVPSPVVLSEPPEATVDAGGLQPVHLPATDADGDPLSRFVTSLPRNGSLFQANVDGSPGAPIVLVPALVQDPAGRVVYEPDSGYVGPDSVTYHVDDGQEASAPVSLLLHVVPVNAPPTAVDDLAHGFAEAPLVISSLATNDVDPEGDPLQVVAVTQPAHGTLKTQEDGTYLYVPDTGFQGTDTFVYVVADEVYWLRSEEYDPGAEAGAFIGNPDDDRFGFPVWRYDYVRGEGLDGSIPWFASQGARLVWDTSWFGGNGLWVRDDDTSPPLGPHGFSHVITSQGNWEHVPVVRWSSPLDGAMVHVAGTVRVNWSGSGGVGSPVDVDLVVALRDVSSGVVTSLFATTLSKPNPGETVGDEVLVPVDLRYVSVDQGDELIVTGRARQLAFDRWINLNDSLAIVPAGSANLGTVTVAVAHNSAPVIDCPSQGTALGLVSSDAMVAVPAHASPTNEMTVALWARSYSETWNVHGALVSKRDAFILYPVQNQKSLRFYIHDGEWLPVGYTPNIDLTQWHHYAGTYDGETLRLFIDGVEVASRPHSGQIDPDTGGLTIGHDDGGASRFLGGDVDEVGIWDVALGEDRIRSNMFRSVAAGEPGLFAYWDFNQESGNTAIDRGPYALHGRLASPFHGNHLPVWIESPTPFVGSVKGMEDVDLLLTLTGTDVDGEPVTTRITQFPAHGVLHQVATDGVSRGALLDTDSVSDPMGRVVYVPEPNYVGEDEVGFVVSDGKATVGPCVHPVWLVPVNDAPVAHPNATSTLQDLGVVTEDVLANDTDIDGGVLTVVDFTQPTNGAVAYLGDGVFSYTPDTAFDGEDGFTYRITDGVATSAPGQVTVEVLPTVEYHWVNPNGGEWGNPANWDRNQAPGENDNAWIDLEGTYTVNLGVDATVSRLRVGASSGTQTLAVVSRTLHLRNSSTVNSNGVFRLGGGVRTGAGELVVDGLFDWQGGSLRDTGMTVVRGRSILSGPGDKWMDGALLRNEGPLVWTDGRLRHRDGSEIVNAAGALWEVQTDRDFEHYTGGVSSFSNQGILRKSGGAGSTDMNLLFHNSGEVEIQVGILNLQQGGSDTGATTIAAGAQLRCSSGTYTVGDTSSIAGEGVFRVAGATVSLGGSFQATAAPQVASGTWNVNVDTTVNGLTFSGGTIGGSGLLVINDQLNWTGGTLAGSGEKIARGTAVIGGASEKWLRGVVLRNEGTLTWTDGRMRHRDGSQIVNAAGALWDVQTERDFEHYTGGVSSFSNQGVLRKSRGTGSTDVSLAFHNSGEVEVQVGILNLRQGGSDAGSTTIGAGAQLSYSGGTHTQAATSSITGEGVFRVAGATVHAAGSFQATAAPQVASGTWNVNTDATVNGLEFGGGTIGGSGRLVINGQLNWTGGTLTGSGEKVAAAGGAISGSGEKWMREASFRNEGQLVWADGRMRHRDGSQIVNAAGALWDVQTERDFEHYTGGVSSFSNQGVLRKSGGTGSTDVSLVFHNSGTLEVQVGILNLRQGGSDVGATMISAGAQLSCSGGTYTQADTSSITGEGVFRVAGATVHAAGSFQATAAPQVASGTWNVNADATVNGLEFSGGTIGGSGLLVVNDRLNWTGGTLTGSGEKIAGGTAVIDGPGHKWLSGVRFRNAGQLVWLDGRMRHRDGSQIVNAAGARWDVQTDRDLEHYTGAVSSFENLGALVKSGGSDTTFAQVHFTNHGSVRAESGTLRFEQSYHQVTGETVMVQANISSARQMNLNGGTLAGEGTLTGSVTVHGTLEPGHEIGSLRITGGYTQGSGAVARFAVAGYDAGGQYDQVIVGGTASLGGSVEVQFVGFLPKPGDRFRVMEWGAFDQPFDGHTVGGLTPDLAATALYSDDGLVISIVSSSGTGSATAGAGITGFEVADAPLAATTMRSSGRATSLLRLRWKGEPGGSFAVEARIDLGPWKAQDAEIREPSPGSYEADIVQRGDLRSAHYRFRYTKEGASP